MFKPAVLIALTAIALLAGCATPPAVEQPPAVASAKRHISPPARPTTLMDVHEQWQMPTCIDLTLSTIDLDAPFDSPPIQRRLRAEFPQSDLERQQGMQHRTWLSQDAAMLFEFDGDQQPVMWMKDTPSSLDIVFFDTAGQAIYTELNTEPNSEVFLAPIDPDPIAKHVLELKAGQARKLGLIPGLASMTLGQIQPC